MSRAFRSQDVTVELPSQGRRQLRFAVIATLARIAIVAVDIVEVTVVKSLAICGNNYCTCHTQNHEALTMHPCLSSSKPTKAQPA